MSSFAPPRSTGSIGAMQAWCSTGRTWTRPWTISTPRATATSTPTGDVWSICIAWLRAASGAACPSVRTWAPSTSFGTAGSSGSTPISTSATRSRPPGWGSRTPRAASGGERVAGSDPAPHGALVVEVLLPELALEVALLARDDHAVDDDHDDRQDQEGPRRVRHQRDPDIGESHSQVGRVPGEAIGACGDDRRGRLPRLDRGALAAESGVEGGEQSGAGNHESAAEDPPDRPRERSVRQQDVHDEADDEAGDVDQRRRGDDAGCVLLRLGWGIVVHNQLNTLDGYSAGHAEAYGRPLALDRPPS